MDLNVFITKALQSKLGKGQDEKDIKALIPAPQKTRPYQNIEKKATPKVYATLMKYFFGEDRGDWKMKWRVQWDIDPQGMNQRKVAEKKLVQDWAWDNITSMTDYGDEKYIYLEKADKNWVTLIFDIDKWFKDNLKGTPKYDAPISLIFKFYKNIPRIIHTHASEMDLRDFIEKKFRLWVNKNKRKLYHRNFKFLKNITPDIFEFRVSFRDAAIKASLKYSVILASLALYTTWFHKKQIDAKQEKDIKKKVSRLGNVKKLDRYIKRLK